MRILKFSAKNVKRITSVTIEPEGSTVNIKGRNAQGKSSALDAIMYAFGGKKTYPKSLIRDGEDEAVITIEVEGYTIERIINRNKADKLKVTSADGMTDTKESFLKALCGSIGLAFDPSEFVREDDKKQLVILKNIVGLDFSEQDKTRAELYADRTQTSGFLKNQKGKLATMAYYPEAPKEEIKGADLMAEYEAALESNKQIELQENALDRQRFELKQFDDNISSHETLIKRHEDTIATANENIVKEKAFILKNKNAKDDHIKAGKDMTDELAAIKKAAIDPAPIKERMASAEDINVQVRSNAEFAIAEETAEVYKKQSDDLTAKIEAIDSDKEKQLKAAKFPVDGLSFDSDGVLYNGVPFGQASQAERIRVSVSIAAALNPKLKIALIRDGSLLDEDSMALLKDLAEEKNLQVWIESVWIDTSKKDKGSFYIEDGALI